VVHKRFREMKETMRWVSDKHTMAPNHAEETSWSVPVHLWYVLASTCWIRGTINFSFVAVVVTPAATCPPSYTEEKFI